jgi:hypothetical protein
MQPVRLPSSSLISRLQAATFMFPSLASLCPYMGVIQDGSYSLLHANKSLHSMAALSGAVCSRRFF